MKTIAFAAAVSLCGLASAAQAGGCDSPYCQGQGRGFGFGGRSPMPAFQAAPWYLYWPYNQHFMTPSPMQGAYSAPPMGYGGLVNPYFPAHGGPVGGASYPAQMPGGYTPPAAPAPMPPLTPAPAGAPGVTPAVTPAPGKVSIPAVPGVIRTSGRR